MKIEMLERVPQRDENAIGVERLLENVVGAELRRFDRGLNGRMPTDHHDDRARVVRPDRLQRLDPVDARHLYVEKDEVRMPPLVFIESVHGGGNGTNLV